MAKYAIVVMGLGECNDQPAGRGRIAHALKTAKALKDAGDEVQLHFHGAAVRWLEAFDKREHKFTQHYGGAFDDVKDTIAGACNFCAKVRFKVSASVDRLGVGYLGEEGEHGTIVPLLQQGFQVITL